MDYLEAETQREVVERLIRGTARDKYRWEETPNNDYRFVLLATPFAFAVLSLDRDDYAPYALEVYNVAHDGAVIKKLQSIETTPEDGDLSEALEELYTMVKRKTLDLDSVAKDLFAALDDLEGEE